jgi:hypothetical protein
MFIAIRVRSSFHCILHSLTTHWLIIILVPEDPAASFLPSRPMYYHDGFDVSFIKEQMKDCYDHHTACLSRVPSPLPTRVINVGPADGSQQPFLLGTKRHLGQ